MPRRGIGAGLQNSTMAAPVAGLGIAHAIVGQPMAVWHDHLPTGTFSAAVNGNYRRISALEVNQCSLTRDD